MLLVALPIAALVMRSSLRVAPPFIIAALITVSPWLIRNVAWTRNPVFPEATSIFGKAHWNDDQVERWRRANHQPRLDQQTLTGRAKAGWEQFFADARYGLALLLAALIAAAFAWRERSSRALLVLLVLMFGFWLFFTHLQSRFLVLTIPVMAILIALAPRNQWMLATIGVAAAIVTICAWATVPEKLAPFVELVGIEQFPAPEGVSDEQTLVLVGDAKAYFYQRPMSRLRYRTVFDVQAEPGESIIDAWSAPRGSNEVLLVDPGELRRLSKTYWKIPPLPREFESRTEPFLLAR
jgi:4-amino-4-deoxy-L-arabinose transferase-like glycosyltransferase